MRIEDSFFEQTPAYRNALNGHGGGAAVEDANATARLAVESMTTEERSALAEVLRERAREEAPHLTVVTWSALTALDLPPREEFLAPLVYSQSLTMLHSWRGTGKTFFALGLAAAVATAGRFLTWQALKARKVLYLDGELPAAVLQERAQAMLAAVPAVGKKCVDNLRLLAADMQEASLPDLASAEGQSAVEACLDGAELLVLDNLSTLVRSGVENEAESWLPLQEWLLSLRRRGVSVLMLHHSGKAGLQRGTSKREDVLDVVLQLRHPTDYKMTDGCRFELEFEKHRLYRGGDALAPIEARYEVIDGRALWTWRSCETATTERVAALLSSGLKQRDIAAELKLSLGSVTYHVKKARAQGLVGS
jgi:hypothetical protein